MFLTISPDFASNLFYDHSGEYAAQAAAINCSGDGSDVLLGSDASNKIPARTISVSVESVELHKPTNEVSVQQEHVSLHGYGGGVPVEGTSLGVSVAPSPRVLSFDNW